MKLFKRSKIYGQAFYRKGALEELGKNSQNIRDHIIRCIVYRDSDTFKHWIQEIGSWLKAVDDVKCKSSLKYIDYREETFGMIGTESHEARLNLDTFKQKYVVELSQYEDFEITETLVSELYDAYTQIIKTSIDWFLKKDDHSISEWRNLVNRIIRSIV